jgi:hypothetical protein
MVSLLFRAGACTGALLLRLQPLNNNMQLRVLGALTGGANAAGSNLACNLMAIPAQRIGAPGIGS